MTDKFFKLGLGTWQFGGRTEPDPNNDDAADIRAIQNAINAGIKHIDTAELYGNGKTEELIGQAIKGYDTNKLFIASKVRDVKLGYDDVIKNCELSLKRMHLDVLDLYYIHKPNPNIDREETAKAFNYLLKNRMIKEIGISNASVETMKAYANLLDKPFFAAQGHYNLIVRQPVKQGVLEYCDKNNINFVAWRPIQLPVPTLGIHALYERGIYPLLDQISDKYNKSNAQIAVRWLTQQNNVNTIFKTSNPQHLKEIMETANFEISKEDMDSLSKNFPLQKDIGFISSGPDPLV